MRQESSQSGGVSPAAFASHGAPTLAPEENEAVSFLRGLWAGPGRPRAGRRVENSEAMPGRARRPTAEPRL